MNKFTYISLLLAMIALLVFVDWRMHLAFFYDWRRSLKTIAAGWLLFLLWDIIGIQMSIFYPGNSRYDLGLLLAPKFPIEEAFFLFSFVYLTLILWSIGEHYADLRSR